MRKYIAMAVCLLIFAGCKAKDEAVVLDNPQQTFDEMSAENRKAWSATILELIPEMEAYEKSKSTFAVKGKANMDDNANLDFDFNAASESDSTNKDDPRMKTTMNVTADLEGEPFEGNAKASLELIIANASVFMSLKDLEVDFPAYPTSAILDPIRQNIGKWYGDTFVSLSEQTGMDIKETYINRMNNPAELREKIGTLITDTELFTMRSFLGEENGFYKFDVELNKPELRNFVEELMEFSAVTEEQKEQELEDFDKEMETLTVEGTLAYKEGDAKYFTFDGTIADAENPDKNGAVVASILEETKSVTMSDTEGSGLLTIEKQGDGNVFSLKQTKTGEEEVEVAKGSVADEQIDVTVYDPESKKENLVLTLTKSGESWSGKITGYQDEQVVFVMEISNLIIDKTNFGADLFIKDEQDKELATINIAYNMEEADSVSIVSPESFEQFSTLLENFLPFMMMGAPGIGAPGGAIQAVSPLPDATEASEATGTDEPQISADVQVESGASTSEFVLPADIPEDMAADLQKQLQELGIEEIPAQ